jgi:hypothetical protein
MSGTAGWVGLGGATGDRRTQLSQDLLFSGGKPQSSASRGQEINVFSVAHASVLIERISGTYLLTVSFRRT